ncbi:MAG: SH3 domain-containing protein [Spirochaetota bacterium]|nr:SH3 domain-containing protein [Spirochaetota bacterium]
MTKITYLLMLLLVIEFTPSAFSKESEKSAIVSAKNGLRLRETPSQKAKILITIPYRSKVTIISENGPREVIEGVSGRWVKVRFWQYNRHDLLNIDIIGYLFDGFLFKGSMTSFILKKYPKIGFKSHGVIDAIDDYKISYKISVKLKSGWRNFYTSGEYEYELQDFLKEGFYLFNVSITGMEWFYQLIDFENGSVQNIADLPIFNSKRNYFCATYSGEYGEGFNDTLYIYKFKNRKVTLKFKYNLNGKTGEIKWLSEKKVQINTLFYSLNDNEPPIKKILEIFEQKGKWKVKYLK